MKHVKQRRFTFYFTAYFVFGGLHVRFESQPEVVRGLHQVLRGSDQNLVNWTRHRPRCLHQRASLSGKERGERGWQMSDGADCFFLMHLGPPEIQNANNHTAGGHTSFITK